MTLNLADCQTLSQLSVALGVSPQLLELLAGESRSTYYKVHRIPKRSARRRGQHRLVYEPGTEELKLLHRTLARRLTIYASQVDPTFPSAVSFGYIRDRSTRANAKIHRGERLVLKADIEDFFPSVSLARTQAIFVRLRIRPDLASLLARVLCLHGSLSPGLSASPLIANLACHDLDSRLLALAAKYQSKYSRYADDLSMSGNALPSKPEIAAALAAEGFQLSETKYRVTKLGQAQFVTGLSVSDRDGPHVPKRMKRRLLQELYYCNRFGVSEHLGKLGEPVHQGVARLNGTVRYVAFVEQKLAKDLRADWDRLTSSEDLDVKPLPKHDRPTTQQYVVIDESIIELDDGRKFLAVAGTLFSDRAAIQTAIDETLGNYLADPFSGGKKGEVRKQGLHFAEAHPELCHPFITRLPALPYRCYVILRRLKAQSDYKAAYLELLNELTVTVFYKCDRQQLEICIEQNPALSEQDLRGRIETLYATFTSGGIARPLTQPQIRVVDKKERLVALPDFMLGVLSRYMRSSGAEAGQAMLTFERLRDRYSLIFDRDMRVRYNRRRPFSPAALLNPQPNRAVDGPGTSATH